MTMPSNFGPAHVVGSLILELTTLPRGISGNFKITGANNS
jgi:hypothetical protein